MSRVRQIITQSSFGGNRCGETFQTQACNLRPCLGKLQIFLLLYLLYLDKLYECDSSFLLTSCLTDFQFPVVRQLNLDAAVTGHALSYGVSVTVFLIV